MIRAPALPPDWDLNPRFYRGWNRKVLALLLFIPGMRKTVIRLIWDQETTRFDPEIPDHILCAASRLGVEHQALMLCR